MLNILGRLFKCWRSRHCTVVKKSSFEVRDGGMSEVRSLAGVVNVVRTRTLSAMGKSQTGAMSRYENDVKSDNERDEREYYYNA